VRVHRLSPAVPMPSYQTAGAAGFDLAANADLTVSPGAIVLVPTGLVMEVPDGHFLAIIARSSTPLKRGLVVPNGVGVVDSDYRGPTDEIKIQIMNLTSEPVEIKIGDRLAQGIVMPFVRVELEDGDGATEPSRGGFGSTG
jgi:dUTP pyrophosphatase